jgi:membrane protease YdiL (CAAX protease family)
MDTAQTKQPAAAIPQLSLWGILWMFAWPALWYLFLIYGLGQLFIPAGGTTPTWYFLFVLAVGTGAELVAGLVLLRREGYPLTLVGLRDRIRLYWPKGWKSWGLAVLLLILGIVLSTLMGPVSKALAGVPGFVPPAWWPAASNPNIQVKSVADVFPDVNLKGNVLFLLAYFFIGLVGNIFGEGIYYRGYLLPRMHGVFGRWDWVANGVLFTLKHVYQRWLYPGILVGGLFFAFAAGPMGSLPLAMAYHWIANFFLPLIMLVLAVFGIG